MKILQRCCGSQQCSKLISYACLKVFCCKIIWFFSCRFLIGREKPGAESEVARLISETLEQERCLYEQHYVHDDTEQVKHCSCFANLPMVGFNQTEAKKV